jgi:carboxyl-terminal processing protease
MWTPLLLLFSLTVVAEPASEPDPMYGRMVKLVQNRYLRRDDLDPVEAFVHAAEQAEASVPWLICEPDGNRVTLLDASTGKKTQVQFGSDEESPKLAALPEALDAVQKAIEGFGTIIDKDIDLPVVLLRGVAGALDRHSVVMAKSRLAKFDERIKGKLTGIGAKLRMVEGVLRTEEVFRETPAERGGLKVEDAIIRVDGVATLGMSIQQAVDRIRGPKDTDVVLGIERRMTDGSDAVVDLVLTRDEVNIPNVTWSLGEDGVGTIRIDHFSEHTSRLTLAALEEFRAKATDGELFKGILLDLRGNTGGSLIQSAETADLFLADGEIVQTSGREGGVVPNLVRSLVAHPAATLAEEPDLPMVVMQNPRSASASEIVAGALSALDRAVIIGRRSFGKGTVQKLYTLRGGHDRVRLKLTVAEYKLHGGQLVHGEGIPTDLTQRRVVFNGSGAWIPSQEDLEVPVVFDVDERSGWRLEGEADLDRDPLSELGHSLLLAMAGAHRDDGIAAIEQLKDSLQADGAARVSDIFRLREIDWQPSDDQPGVLDAEVTVEMMSEARAGESVTLRAEVRNDGPAPLYQVRVRLLTDKSRTPWNGTTIPIGFVPPGESALGEVRVAIRTSTPDRSDDVTVHLEADRLEPVDLQTVVFAVKAVPPPPLTADVRLVPHDDHHRIEVELENRGESILTGLMVQLGWRDDSGIELIDREGRLNTLAPGQKGRVDLAVRVLESAPEDFLPVEIRVGAERFPRLLRVPVDVLRSGDVVHIEEPTIKADAPTRVSEATVTVPISATDDGGIADLTVWWHGEKVAWVAGDGPRLDTSVELPMNHGPNGLTIVVSDNEDNVSKAVRYLWGELKPEPEPGAEIVAEPAP